MPDFIPQTLGELTPEWLTVALRTEGVIESANITGYTSEVIGAGLIGSVARLTLEYDCLVSGNPTTLIVKLPTTVAKNREIGEHGDYEREMRFYQELADSLPVRCPRCYVVRFDEDSVALSDRRIGTKPGRRFLLILEDMAPARGGDDIAGCGVNQATAVLRTAARLHASYWENARLAELWWAWQVGGSSPSSQRLYVDSHPVFLDHYRDQLPRHMFGQLDWLAEHGNELQQRLSELPRTLLHVDFRLDNLFFSDATADAEVTLFDWQTPGLGPAAMDIASFLGKSLHEGVSPRDKDQLLHIYHDALIANDVDDYSFESFQHHYEICLMLILRTLVTNFVRVDWGTGPAARRRDLHVTRIVTSLADVRPDRLLR